jgi:hypothetical protein
LANTNSFSYISRRNLKVSFKEEIDEPVILMKPTNS